MENETLNMTIEEVISLLLDAAEEERLAATEVTMKDTGGFAYMLSIYSPDKTQSLPLAIIPAEDVLSLVDITAPDWTGRLVEGVTTLQ